MWRRASQLSSSCQFHLRRFSTAVRRQLEDEGDWFYSSEWWGTDSDGQTVFRSTSDKGNGIVSVLAYPSSRPSLETRPDVEKWLQQRSLEIYPDHEYGERLRVLGYQWRVLRFNDDTRQSAAKVMAIYRETEPASIHLMQQQYCLAVPYLKSMVSVGLAAIASCNYDIKKAIEGTKSMHILCIGHGGGSLPLFLASKIRGAVVHIVEIDPLVISASIQAMGFPRFSVMNQAGNRVTSEPDAIDQVMWKGIHERLYLYESDAENFVIGNANTYDMVFIDAYDGEDIFPWKLWDPNSPFLEALSSQLHPGHGTVVVNLHSDSGLSNSNSPSSSGFEPILPMGKYVARVCQAYKNVLLEGGRYDGEGRGFCNVGFTVEVPWVHNTSLVLCRGFGMGRDMLDRDLVVHALLSKSVLLERMMNLPFSLLQYIKRGLVLVD